MALGPIIKLAQGLAFLRLNFMPKNGERGRAVLAEKEITSSPAPLKRYYTDDELCELFQVSKRTTFRWRELGMIGFMRVPGSQHIRYTRAHIEAFEKRGDVEAKQARRKRKAADPE